MARVSRKTAEAILANLPPNPPVPVDGGPIVATHSALATLWLIPWFCDPSVQAVLLTRADGLHEWQPVFVAQGIEDTPAWLIAKFAAAAGKLAPGTEFEIAAANTGWVMRDTHVRVDALLTAGNQRYRGTIEANGRIAIRSSWPALDAGSLRRALALCEQVGGSSDEWADNEREAAEAIAQGRRSFFFAGNKIRARVEPAGKSVPIAQEWRAFVALLFFRLRFAGGPWDVETWRRLDEKRKEDWEHWEGQMQAAMAKAAEKWRPTLRETLLTTERGSYGRGDVFEFAWENEHLLYVKFSVNNDPRTPFRDDEGELSLAAAVGWIDADMRALGLSPLGDLAGTILGRQLLRCYAGAGHFATLLVSAGDAAFDYSFYARVGDGRWAVTTTRRESAKLRPPTPADALADIASAGSGTAAVSSAQVSAPVSVLCANLPVQALFALHAQQQPAGARGSAAAEVPATLEAAARWIDDYASAKIASGPQR